MTTASAAVAAPFDTGWACRGVLRVFRRRGLTLLLASLPTVFLPAAVSEWLPDQFRDVGRLLGLFTLAFVGAGSAIAYRELDGDDPESLGSALGDGVGNFRTLWGIGFLSVLATALGLLLLIVPGVFILVSWMSASTAAVVEELGAVAALSRSWTLSRGNRWRLAAFAGLVLLGLLGMALALFAVDLALIIVLDTDVALALTQFVVVPLALVLGFGVTTVASTAAYAGLRKAVEGVSGDVAEVFA